MRILLFQIPFHHWGWRFLGVTGAQLACQSRWAKKGMTGSVPREDRRHVPVLLRRSALVESVVEERDGDLTLWSGRGLAFCN